VLTPLIFLLIWAIERTETKATDSLFTAFPYWKLTAAVVAFLVWALAVPGNPYAISDIGKVVAAFVALVVSIFLDLVDQLIEVRKNSVT
jgi:hypothetical protein